MTIPATTTAAATRCCGWLGLSDRSSRGINGVGGRSGGVRDRDIGPAYGDKIIEQLYSMSCHPHHYQ